MAGEHFGRFDDASRSYVIENPVTPRPWINYLGNRRLSAFISHNAGGLMWYLEPHSRRLSRYHYTAAPGDRPGFYVYIRDRRSGEVWNPHFAPTCAGLDRFTCRHAPGRTAFTAQRKGIEATLEYGIPPDRDAMVWSLRLTNTGTEPAELQAASYLEFGLLEFMREAVGWCYLKNHFSLKYDRSIRAIRYDYHVFEAPYSPRMLFGCTEAPSGWDCSRDAFIGRTGSLERPMSLRQDHDLSNSDLPLGGHACAVLGIDVKLAPGETRELAFVFALADDWAGAESIMASLSTMPAVREALGAIDGFWGERLDRFQAETGDGVVDRAVNTWIPYNSLIALEHARIISTDHMGTDGLRYRDTMQDALAGANLDPGFAAERMRQVFSRQTRDGGGCFAFFPYDRREVRDEPHRSDNTVWPVDTVLNWLAETGDMGLLEQAVPYRDGGAGSVYDHVLRGLRHIAERCGPRGLPTLFHADWNDGLALFGDPGAESVMLGMQMVHACRRFGDLAARIGRDGDAAWCRTVAAQLARLLNSNDVWDGRWYRRLLLSNGRTLGSAANPQGSIFLNPQSWAVISGVGQQDGRGVMAMDAVSERLDTRHGLRILDPPFTGIPDPTDPPLGSNPGVGENGGIFCHANTWAIIAECMLGRAERAFAYFRQLLPEVESANAGAGHYQREPYVLASSIVGPGNPAFGEGGISWLTGTASWLYVAATQHILGVRPTLDGLTLDPCLPAALPEVRVQRRYRGGLYDITLRRNPGAALTVTVNGAPWTEPALPVEKGGFFRVVCEGARRL